MGISFARQSFGGSFPEIWRGECKMLPAGFKLTSTISAGTVIRRGTLVEVDFSNLTARVAKRAVVLSGGTATKPRIGKGHLFAVGDVVTKEGSGSASPTISAIDTSNSSYDTLTLSAEYSGLTTDDVLVESTAQGYYDAESTDEGALKVVANNATPDTGEVKLSVANANYHGTKNLAVNDYVILKDAEELCTPNMVVGEELKYSDKGIPTLDVAYQALVIRPNLLYVVPDKWLDGGCCLKNNHEIKFIKQ